MPLALQPAASFCRDLRAALPQRRPAGLRARAGRENAGWDGSGGGGGESGGDAEQELRRQARLLNELFFAPPAAETHDDAAAEASEAPPPGSSSAAPGPLEIPDLPLWRVQWAALPGSREVLHVHVPHYCDMFERLFRQPRPWRFGHLYLPEGSKNLGSPEFALRPGTKAPLAGTLMEVLQAVRFVDGRLLVLAVGVARFRALREVQAVPYCRADVQLLVDAEEQRYWEGPALQAADAAARGLGGGDAGELEAAALMRAVPVAARQAAAAYSLAWLDYELSEARLGGGGGGDGGAGAPAVIDISSRPGEAQLMGRRLAAIAGNEVMELPFYEPLAQAAAAAAPPLAAEESSGGQAVDGCGGQALQGAVAALRPVLRRTEADARVLATSAAAAAVESQLSGGGDASTPLADATINSAAERGVDVRGPDAACEHDEDSPPEPDSLETALKLEAAVWREIDSVHALGSKLRERAAPLQPGLCCLRPWPGEPAAAAGPRGGGSRGGASARLAAVGAHPDYPAMRRVQRLSYAVASMLGSVTAAEGRQAWVEAGSTCTRLRLGLSALREHRRMLAAVVAVEGL